MIRPIKGYVRAHLFLEVGLPDYQVQALSRKAWHAEAASKPGPFGQGSAI